MNGRGFSPTPPGGKLCRQKRPLMFESFMSLSIFRRPHTRLAFDGIFAAWRRDKRPPFDERGFGESDVRQFRGLAAEREIFAEREVRITFPHDDAAQVGMPAKADAH